MAWVRIDDQMPQHPKLAQAGPLGLALQLAALCYCNRQLTDGFIPWSVAQSLISWQFSAPAKDGSGDLRMTIAVTNGMRGDDVDSDYVIALLLASGVWKQIRGGYRIHDYQKYQPTKKEVLEGRAKKQVAGQAGGQASAQARAQRIVKQKGNDSSTVLQAKSNPNPNPNPVPHTPRSRSSSRSNDHTPTTIVSPLGVGVPSHPQTTEALRGPPYDMIAACENYLGRCPSDWHAQLGTMKAKYTAEELEHGFSEAHKRHGRTPRYVEQVIEGGRVEDYGAAPGPSASPVTLRALTPAEYVAKRKAATDSR